jgi:diadenosine tetraphosphate (Ap4A) HIT family hydrolase
VLSLSLTDIDDPCSAPRCAFCALPAERIIDHNEHAILIMDGYPISPGHALVIPKRHVGSFFDVTNFERENLLAMLDRAKAIVQERYAPDGYNIGINDGTAAGQTVPHLHVHLIPRYHGDPADPRGGVRWIIPAKADYWTCP